MTDSSDSPPNTLRALVLGNGGVLGAAYEIGVLTAAEERFGEGAIWRGFDLFVGTGAGAFVAALVGQGVPPGRVYDAFREQDPSFYVERHEACRVELGRLVRRKSYLSLEPLKDRVRQVLIGEGLVNSFLLCPKPVLIPALDVDDGERRVFGADTTPDVTIAEAIAASCAVPPRVMSTRVVGRRYRQTPGPNLDLALERGARSAVVIDPAATGASIAQQGVLDIEPPVAGLPHRDAGRWPGHDEVLARARHGLDHLAPATFERLRAFLGKGARVEV